MAGSSDTLKVGDRAPDFTLAAANSPDNFSPNCVKRMAQFEPHKDEISQLGSLLFIAAEKRDGLFKPEKYLAEHPISFPFLLDEQRTVWREPARSC